MSTSLTNGRHRVTISEAGTGQSFWDWIALNRRHGETVDDSQGFFIYLRDLDSDQLWSTGLQPTVTKPQRYSTSSTPNRFTIERSDHGINSTMEVSVVDEIETRSVVLKNETGRPRRIELTSCIEVALAHPTGDLGHPAFSKLFVQTEWLPACHALVAKRRPRAHGESWPAMFHAMIGAKPAAWETDRVQFIGRGRNLARPAAIMSGTVGSVLDPVFCLRTTVELAPGGQSEVGFVLGAVADHSQIESIIIQHQQQAVVPAVRPVASCVARNQGTQTPEHDTPLHRFNGFGGYNEDGTEYVVRMPWVSGALRAPPMPWCNVIANERFGFITSETGAGCTWSRNSQANRLTPWSNDPVSDPHSEAFYLRDEDNGEFWSPLPGPCPADADYEMAHGFGYSRCHVKTHGLKHETTMFVPRADPVKLVRMRLKNEDGRVRRLSLFTYHQIVLGTLPPEGGSIIMRCDGDVLLAVNPKSADFSDGTAFSFGVLAVADIKGTGFSFDRRNFIGENGSAYRPRALKESTLDGQIEQVTDPCFAHHWSIELPPDGTLDFCMVLGEATCEQQLQILIGRYREISTADAALVEVTEFWRNLLGGVRVKTPSPEIDLLVNGWLTYQAIGCRMWGRTAYYQSSAAFGFRDQLQDAGNLKLLWPGLTRQQILLHAAHQFVEGDVLHWWHEAPVDRGVRTRFSDDLLWLPHVTSEYVIATGDVSLFDEIVPFLQAPLLKPGEDENYLKPTLSEITASVLEHCCLAIDRSLTCGAHGLPLMGTGDWNDGMNRVGREGKGESVWLGFFLYEILGNFIPLMRQRGDATRVVRYAAYRESLHAALNNAGWDGEWYRRAYYDDGTPLGTKGAHECRIDGLAQSWAVLSGAAPQDRAEKAMNAAEQQLISETDGLIRLLTPPFVNAKEDPGYIKGYVAGVRENGGQYTHAACWVVRAMAKLGRRDRAARLLEMLSPLWHTRTPEDVERYKVEPYVIAADVYGAAHVGRGGWTWYTGSAGWAWRVAVESVLGLRIENGNTLVLKPCVPDAWPSYQIDYQYPGSKILFVIEVRNPDACTECVAAMEMEGILFPVTNGEARVPIPKQDGTFKVRVILGTRVD